MATERVDSSATEMTELPTAPQTAPKQDTIETKITAMLHVPMAQGNVEPISICMSGMEKDVKDQFLVQTGYDPLLVLKHMCMSEDYEHFISSVRLIKLYIGHC